MAIPEELKPIQPEPEDARLLQHIRDWLELNRIERNIRDAKRPDNQERRERSESACIDRKDYHWNPHR